MIGDNSSQKIQLSTYLPKIPLEKRINFMHQIALLLRGFHEDCMTYRDIHLTNIDVQIQEDKHTLSLKPTQFMQRLSSRLDRGVMRGEQYKIKRPAPQMVDHQSFEQKSDIYALGLVFHEIYERKPFVYPPNELGDIGQPQLKPLIYRMIERNVKNRPNIQQVCDQLKTFSFFRLPLTETKKLSAFPIKMTGKREDSNFEMLCVNFKNEFVKVYGYLRYDGQVLFLGLKDKHNVCYSEGNLPTKVKQHWGTIEDLFYYFKQHSLQNTIYFCPNKMELLFQDQQRKTNFVVDVLNQNQEQCGFGVFISNYHILILAIYLSEKYSLHFQYKKRIEIKYKCNRKNNIPQSQKGNTFALIETACYECTPLKIKFKYFQGGSPEMYPLKTLQCSLEPVTYDQMSPDTLKLKSENRGQFFLGDFLFNQIKNRTNYGVAYICSTGHRPTAKHFKPEMLKRLIQLAKQSRFQRLKYLLLYA